MPSVKSQSSASATPDNHLVQPPHYRDQGVYSGLHVAEAWELGFHLGNTIKYIQRAGKKLYAGYDSDESRLTDLRKARWYLQRYLYLLDPDNEKDPLE